MQEHPDHSDKNALADRLNSMREEYQASLPEKIRKMHQAWDAIQLGTESSEAVDTLYWLAHNLAGSGTTFGFPQISSAARGLLIQLTQFKAGGGNPDVESMGRIGSALSALSGIVDFPAADRAGTARDANESVLARTVRQNRKLIFLVDDDREFALRVGEKLRDYGYAVNAFYTTREFETALMETLPDVILMDMKMQEGDLAGADSVQRVSGKLEHVPVVFLSVREDLESRLSAARVGSYYYFTKPVDMLLLHQTLDHLTQFWGEPAYQVLMVDDDEYLTSVYQSILGDAGIRVDVLNDPTRTIEMIDSKKPDLILLDVHMPGISGLEIGAVIRQFEAYLHIPIVFLTADQDMGKRLASMHLGGDDFLGKSIEPAFLVEVIRTRIEKSRALKSGEQQIKRLIREFENHKYAQDNHSVISVADVSGNILDVNERFCELSGYGREELIGRNYRLLKSGFHPDDFYRTMWQTLTAGKVWHGQIRNRRKNGEFYWVDSTTTPILDEFGAIEKYISVRTDITKLKELEHSLSEERERLSLAMDATNTGLWEWNLADNKTYYSARCRLLLKLDGETEISWPELIHPDDFEAVSEQLIRHISGNSELYASEHRKHNAAGGWDWVYESGKVVERDDKGEILRMVGTMQIINERKELEALQEQLSQQLLQSSKMEAIGHLTSGIAHDFNNILGGMLGYVELATSMLNRDTPKIDNLQRYLHEIQNAGTRAKELVAQMLIFTRLAPETEGGDVPSTWVFPVIKEIISLLISSIPSTIKLNFHLPPQDIRVAIQPVHLHQILLNLGINARDAMGEYGEMDLGVQETTIHHATCAACHQLFNGNFVEFAVKDTGGGIPPEILNKIFDPFFTTKQAGKGTGMGLSVVNGVVHTLGGHVRVETEFGRGSTFHILLPVADRDGEDELPQSQEAELAVQDLAGLRILLVDDEHTMAAMLTEFLNMHGAVVSTYTASSAALKAFLQNPDNFDLVITDETMPELSGLDMSRKMLELKQDLPIILCTGFSEHATPEKVKEAGVAVLMAKPLKVSLLMENIRSLMSGR